MFLSRICMFLVNGMFAHVHFDSGATRSFMSLTLSKNFDVVSGALNFLLDEKVVDDRTVIALRVHINYVVEMFQV